MAKFKKIDKEFQLTDSSVNCYGFRLLTSGYQQGEFEKNPIGYYMHERYSGVLLKWEDFRIEADAVYAKPVINTEHYRAQQTINEIENGFLNAASVGHLVVLEYTDDLNYKLPNQDGPTVTKWFNRECSIVDIPGNFNSLALFDKDENPLNLADFTGTTINKNFEKMKQIFLTAEQIGKLNLKAETADAAAVDVAFNDLLAKANKVDDLTLENTNLKAEKKSAEDAKAEAEQKLTALKANTETEKVNGIVADALAAKKITVEAGEKLKKQFAGKSEALKDLVDSLQAYAPITTAIAGVNANAGAVDLAAKDWDELHKEGKLEALKASNLDAFKEKFKAKFGKEYKD